jgi:hypothetical protein
LLDKAPEQALGLSVEQAVKLCGDGKLKDNSDCSTQFRSFLARIPSDLLAAYTSQCLSVPFDASGSVLQDVVNEMGRRLEYNVENGLYQGRVNRIGYDGIWRSEHAAVVVEVKTTDAYRISLDRIDNYLARLVSEHQIPPQSHCLIVVGRQDTGDLEAQVRGSRQAWSIRLISVEALAKLVAIKERTEEPTRKKIHELLIPFEYTKLDRIIDVAFDVAEDASTTVESEAPAAADSDPDISEAAQRVQSPTPREEIEKIRQRIAIALSLEYRPVIKKSGVLYWSTDKELRAIIAVSKHYEQRDWPYWYQYRPQWDSFLRDAKIGLYVLGCVDLDIAYAIPFGRIHGCLPRLRTTPPTGTPLYWHVDLQSSGPDGQAAIRLVEPPGREILSGLTLKLR